MDAWGNLGVDWTSADTIRGTSLSLNEIMGCHQERMWGKDDNPPNMLPFPSYRAGTGFPLKTVCDQIEPNGGTPNVMNSHVNHTLGADVVFSQSGESYPFLPVLWTKAAYLTASGDSAWLPSCSQTAERGKSILPEKLYQLYKMYNLMKWGTAYGEKEYNGDGSLVRFNHPIASSNYDTGRFKPHTWEVWTSIKHDLGWSYPVKTHSEFIATDINEGDDPYYSGWYSVAAIGARFLGWGHQSNIIKFDGTDGYGYRNW